MLIIHFIKMKRPWYDEEKKSSNIQYLKRLSCSHAMNSRLPVTVCSKNKNKIKCNRVMLPQSVTADIEILQFIQCTVCSAVVMFDLWWTCWLVHYYLLNICLSSMLIGIKVCKCNFIKKIKCLIFSMFKIYSFMVF